MEPNTSLFTSFSNLFCKKNKYCVPSSNVVVDYVVVVAGEAGLEGVGVCTVQFAAWLQLITMDVYFISFFW